LNIVKCGVSPLQKVCCWWISVTQFRWHLFISITIQYIQSVSKKGPLQ